MAARIITYACRAEVSQVMAFPKRVCVICSEEFELKPGKPGYANRCPACSEEGEITGSRLNKAERATDRELTDARSKAMRDLLYWEDN